MFEDRIWDYTSLDIFLTCRKKFYWRIVRGLTPERKAPALSFGSGIHDALDLYYTDGNMEMAIKKFEETHKDTEDETLRTVAIGKKVLEWYAKVYPTEPFEVFGKPEIGFTFPIGDIMWGGRIDLPIRWSGDLWVMEHKTTSRLSSYFFHQFELNMQVSSYILALEAFTGEKVQGCMINAIEPWKELKRPTAKSKKPEDHFARSPIPRLPHQKEQFKETVQQVVRDIKICSDKDEWYPNEHSCIWYNRKCPFHQLCHFGENPRIVERDYVVEFWEPYKEEEDEKQTNSN